MQSDVTGIRTQASTAGGTSDGRFIAPTGTEVVEFGTLNDSIHKIDAVGAGGRPGASERNLLPRHDWLAWRLAHALTRNCCRNAVSDVTGIRPQASTAGSTSDGRFIACAGTEVVEFGTLNDSIHKIDAAGAGGRPGTPERNLLPRHDWLAWRLAHAPTSNCCKNAVSDVTGIRPQASTAGGTSDGRFIAPAGTEVVEFGTLNDSIHKIDAAGAGRRPGAPERNLLPRHDWLAWRLAHAPTRNCCRNAVSDVTGIRPQASTAGGTSDGRFIAPAGTEVVEFGTLNDSIHKIDAAGAGGRLGGLSEICYRVMTGFLGD